MPGLPAIPGILDSPVVDPYEILRRPHGGIGRALVIGGDIRGVAIARMLADKDVDVVLVEPSRELVTDIGMRSRRFQIGALEGKPNVTIHLGTTVEALGERTAVLWDGTERWEVEIDLVVPTRMLLPVTDVADELCEQDPVARGARPGRLRAAAHRAGGDPRRRGARASALGPSQGTGAVSGEPVRTHNLLAVVDRIRDRSLSEHRAVIAAFAKGDLGRAETILEQHIWRMRLHFHTARRRAGSKRRG